MAMAPHWRWCTTCDRPKPPLSHHCSICNKCVLKMVSAGCTCSTRWDGMGWDGVTGILWMG